jgi:formiminotetrahydrofolate cyclodeaminase
MSERTATAELRMIGWLSGLASDEPTPGGGAVAAVSAATGAALVAMVARLTARKAGFETVAARMDEIIDEADRERSDLLALADRDAVAFDAVMAAYRMPRESDDEKAARLRALQAGLEHAAEIPLMVARRAVYLMGLAEEVIAQGNPNAASDGFSGAAVLHAATLAALANVQINAFAFVDQTRRAELVDDCRHLRDRADQVLADADEAFSARVEGQ